ncbi:hypothetical protein P692DRAFT_20831431 [Suillus brevipes Sb2]|nr:hypothetical protein P692DRAFT_20831431 [Suillus brevipes Sb2]
MPSKLNRNRLNNCKSSSPRLSGLRLFYLTSVILSPLQNFILSSIVLVINAYAAALPPGEFSGLLQNPNTEGHTLMYWAVVNDQREACSVFNSHILQFASVCSSGLRLACMSTSVYALFTLGHVINR